MAAKPIPINNHPDLSSPLPLPLCFSASSGDIGGSKQLGDSYIVDSGDSSNMIEYPHPCQETTPPPNHNKDKSTTSNERHQLIPCPNRPSINRDENEPQQYGGVAPQGVIDQERDQQHRICRITRCHLFIIGGVVVTMVIIMVIGLYLLIVSSTSSDTSSINYTIIDGDFVLLDINANLKTIHQWLYTISLTSNNTNNTLVDVYKVKCDQLDQYERENFFNDSFRQYFQNCSQFYGFCLITEYFYQVRSITSVAVYHFFINPFVDPSLNFLVYDDEIEFHRFLEGKGNGEAIYNEAIDFRYSTFSFSVSDMRKEQSYYFFAIEIIRNDNKHHPSIWYDVTRTGVHVTYKGVESIDPFCTISSNTTCDVPLPLNNEYCFVGHFEDTSSPISFIANGVPSAVVVTAMLTRLSTFYYVLIAGCVLFIIPPLLFISVACIMYCRSKRR